MRAPLLSLSCVLLSSYLFWRTDASCYYPDGSFPDDYIYVPCSGDEFTSCCILGEDQCLSNGLCYYSWSDSMYRSACTDQSWNSTNCFQHCKTGDYASNRDELVHCGDNRYCCYSDGSTCCNDDSKVFTVDTGTIIKDLATTGSYSLPIETPTQLPVATVTSDRGTIETSSVEATNSRPKTTSTDTRATITGTGTRATNAAAAATSTNEPSESSDSGSDGLSKTALIAIAVAGIVVLLLAIGLVWFFVRRRYRRKLAAGNTSQSYPMSSDGFQKLPDKSPRPVEVPAPINSPAPPYQPPAYHPPPLQHNAVEIDNSLLPPGRNPWGQPVFEAPAQPYRQM
ncbi:hypothetical protein CC78DRAFT_531745 [Lojkania enalia]|uniref:Mid2 domain-containing protein n=1 Tax=Lojkania enalia TaxID=147567 RepID=A0A9P4KH64_9PLEO|nr:hypothetical protein CC78DRAFT_531745 [Didymosphaeria enalia]